MGLHNQNRNGPTGVDYDDISTRSTTKNVLRWFKKAVGLGPASLDQTHGRPTRYVESRRSQGNTFVSPNDTLGPQDPQPVDTTRSFHSNRRVCATPAPGTYSVGELQPPRHVLIVGASLSGLCLAQGLKRVGIPFTVFEGDATPSVSDGYHVHIDTTGYDALKAMLPDETFELFLRSAGQAFPDTVWRDAHSGNRVSGDFVRQPPCQSSGISKQVFSMNRTVFLSVLLHGLDEGTEIQFNRVFQRYRVLPNKMIEVQFTNGLLVRGTVLIGADGKSSRVRDQLIPSSTFSGLDAHCCMIYGKTRVTAGLTTAKLACPNTTTVITEPKSKISLRIEPLHAPGVGVTEHASEPVNYRPNRRRQTELCEEDELFVSWSLLARTDKFLVDRQMNCHDLDAMAPFQLADVARRMTSKWHPVSRAVVEAQAPAWCAFRSIQTASPQLPAWPRCGVTLLGDAAHATPPADIGGANLALEDATMLCDRFVRIGVGLPAIAMYEKQMRLAVREAVLASVHTSRQLVGVQSNERMAPAVQRDRKTKSRSTSQTDYDPF